MVGVEWGRERVGDENGSLFGCFRLRTTQNEEYESV